MKAKKNERHYCCRCGKELDRVYYQFPYLCGEYCSDCSHEIYRAYGIAFYANDRKDNNKKEKEMRLFDC
jgi:hypothetical protein